MHGIFSLVFPGLLESIYVQERIIEEMMPEAYAAFKRPIISTLNAVIDRITAESAPCDTGWCLTFGPLKI